MLLKQLLEMRFLVKIQLAAVVETFLACVADEDP